MVDVKIGITRQPVKRKIDEPLERGYFLRSVQCPTAFIGQRAPVVGDDDPGEVLKPSLPDKRISFKIQEYIAG